MDESYRTCDRVRGGRRKVHEVVGARPEGMGDWRTILWLSSTCLSLTRRRDGGPRDKALRTALFERHCNACSRTSGLCDPD
jgi:hypothetical protein